MDPARFDRISRRVGARRFSRRRAARGLGAVSIAAALLDLRRESAAADCPDIALCYRSCLPEERTAGFCSDLRTAPVPSGPYGACWSWSEFVCNPCSGQSWNDLHALCNQVYAFCKGQCKASFPF